MGWAILVYRRRKGETGLPEQLRYNNPIEVLFTVIPLILVIGFFAFTARDIAAIEQPTENPDVTIQVIGKQWSWDFNYVDANVYESGIQAQFEGQKIGRAHV
jgi:cytochrome c oxidase subunit 2